MLDNVYGYGYNVIMKKRKLIKKSFWLEESQTKKVVKLAKLSKVSESAVVRFMIDRDISKYL